MERGARFNKKRESVAIRCRNLGFGEGAVVLLKT